MTKITVESNDVRLNDREIELLEKLAKGSMPAESIKIYSVFQSLSYWGLAEAWRMPQEPEPRYECGITDLGREWLKKHPRPVEAPAHVMLTDRQAAVLKEMANEPIEGSPFSEYENLDQLVKFGFAKKNTPLSGDYPTYTITDAGTRWVVEVGGGALRGPEASPKSEPELPKAGKPPVKTLCQTKVELIEVVLKHGRVNKLSDSEVARNVLLAAIVGDPTVQEQESLLRDAYEWGGTLLTNRHVKAMFETADAAGNEGDENV